MAVSLVESLRASRKHPAVLKLRVLKIRGEDPDVLIFFYEGPEDIPVYEEWMGRIANCPRYEPVPGAGKQQLLAYHEQLKQSADPLLEKIFFFVDRDFDLPVTEDGHLFELDCYSIENLVCTEDVLESILRDEFRRAGSLNERARVRAKFAELRAAFAAFCLPVNFLLFAAQRSSARVIRKPDRVTEIVTVSATELQPAYAAISEIVTVEGLPDEETLAGLRAEYDGLPDVLQQRGKYVLDMFRRWLRALTEDLKSPEPAMFDSQDDRLPGDPSSVSLRRLASSAPMPVRLSQFVATSVVGR